MRNTALLAVACLLALSGATASAETQACTTISSIPTTITSPGTYCLKTHLSTWMSSGAAIGIMASDVRLDLNGWTLAGPGIGTAARGIYVSDVAERVTVENGTVTGFLRGIDAWGPGVRLENLLLDHNTSFGIRVAGTGSLVRANRVISTGGAKADEGSAGLGIYVGGAASLVDGNLVSGLTHRGDAGEIGIYLVNAHNTVLRNNVVIDDEKPDEKWSHGISVNGSKSVTVQNNSITNFWYGLGYWGSDGTYAQNVVVGCDAPYSGGTKGSDND